MSVLPQDMTDAIEACASTHIVEDIAAGTRTAEGLTTRGAITTFEIRALIVPATPEQLDRLPTGQRPNRTIAVFTGTELRTADTPGGKPAHVVRYLGKRFEVGDVSNWEAGSFFEVLAQEIKR